MSKLKLSVLLFLAVSLSVYAFQSDGTGILLRNLQEKDTLTLQSFQKDFAVFGKADPGFEVTWNETRAVPSSVTGKFLNCDSGDLMKLYSAALPDNLILTRARSGSGHEVFEYVFNGIRVFPGVLTYTTGAGGFMLAGSFIHNVEVRNSFRYDKVSCEKIAMEYLNLQSKRMDTQSEKVYFDTNNGLKSAYLFTIGAAQPLGDFQIVVEDEQGEVVYCDNLMQFFEGRGSIYMTNPIKCGVTVEKFIDIKDSGFLRGSWVKIENGNSSASAANSPSNEFVYDTTETHFDEAMVYFHLNRIHNYYRDTFNYHGMDRQVRAIVHYGTNYDNAFFSPLGGYFGFGDGNKLNDLSRESAIAYHEYTHSVTSDITGMGNSGEAGGMNEGFSDYFGDTLDNDPDVGEWACAKMGKPYLRSCKNNTHYPEDIQNECHKDSLMWSAPLWEMREAFGASVADALIHYSRFHLNSQSNFADGLKAILMTDDEKFGGLHKNQILKIFAARGIMQNSKTFSDRLREKEMVRRIYGGTAMTGEADTSQS
ncbi:MAG: M36 family metallopeptidase [Candidatus Wallbacteria bacterium]|nr:M36 family metallopeptidase [Candidatus Wallbacteria bacterium]